MMHQQPAPLPPWLFLVIGVMGVFMARGGGLTSDLVRTVSDSMRTLAILAVIVFGCFMVLRDLSEQQQQPPPRRIVQSPLPPPTPGPPMVTMTAQQFKVLLDMASSAPLAVMAPAEENKQPKSPAQALSTPAPDVVVVESQNLSGAENSEIVS